MLHELPTPHLLKVFNVLTGQTVTRFTDRQAGMKRVQKALDGTNTDLTTAMEMAGLTATTAPKVPQFEDANGTPASTVAEDSSAYANADADGPQKHYKRDKYGFVHRKSRTTTVGNATITGDAAGSGDGGESPKRKRARKPVGAKTERVDRKQQVLGLLRHGATVAQIMDATGWLPHTTRAFLSKGGALAKAGINVTSSKVEQDGTKVTVYRVGA